MNYVDFTLVRLADPDTRASLFDALALEQLAAAGYADDAATLTGPYQPTFREVQMGLALSQRAILDGSWQNQTGAERHESRFVLTGLGAAGVSRIDMLWRGGIVARVSPANARIIEETSSWPDTSGIDAEISAALGALPSDPSALETERRARFLARIRAGLRQPEAFSDAAFTRWLAELGAVSVSALMAQPGVRSSAALTLRYSDPAAVAATPRELPITAAVLLRDGPLDLAGLLAESQRVGEQLREAGVERARDERLSARSPTLVVWMVPETVFDDADWPGGGTGNLSDQRLGRRRTAARWLGPAGVVFAPTPAHS